MSSHFYLSMSVNYTNTKENGCLKVSRLGGTRCFVTERGHNGDDDGYLEPSKPLSHSGKQNSCFSFCTPLRKGPRPYLTWYSYPQSQSPTRHGRDSWPGLHVSEGPQETNGGVTNFFHGVDESEHYERVSVIRDRLEWREKVRDRFK